MKRKFFTPKTIAGLGILTAMVIVLQLLSNYVQFGPVSITLALFPIAVGAMIYGPFGGLFLGIVDGVLVLTAPSTISFFFSFSPFGTIIVCLLKTGLAGFISGLIFKLYNKDIKVEYVAALVLLPFLFIVSTNNIFSGLLNSASWGNVLVGILRFVLVFFFVFLVIKGTFKPSKNSVIYLSCLAVPVINTLLFSFAALTIFSKKILPMADSMGQNAVYFLVFSFIGWNFFLEFVINALLASAFHATYKSIGLRLAKRG